MTSFYFAMFLPLPLFLSNARSSLFYYSKLSLQRRERGGGGWKLWLEAVAGSCGCSGEACVYAVTLQDNSCRSIGAFVGGDAFEDGAQGHVGGELRLGARVGSWSCG